LKKKGKKLGLVCFAAVIGLSFLAGCSGAGAPASPATASFTDQAGRTIALQGTPQRIVSLAPSNTEILFALGLADNIVGVTDYDDYPPEAKEKPSIGGFSTPNIEEVVAKDPDLVVAASIHESKIVPELEARGLTVLVLAPKTIDQVMDAIMLVGEVTGKENMARTIIFDMQKRVNAIIGKTDGLALEQRPSTCFIVWHDPLMIAGSGTFHDELIEKAGGTNIGHALTGYSQDFSLEDLIMADPQVIIAGVGMGTGEDKPLQFVLSEPRLKDVAARRNNRVYPIDQDIVGRAGPRIVDALEQFAALIHPELFK
jgi:iron complex transport system substrate-binding protein